MSKSTRDEIRICNCAKCGRELVSRLDAIFVPKTQQRARLVAARINDRPYCVDCLITLRLRKDP